MSDDVAEPTAPSIEERVGDDATLRAVLQAFAQLSPEDQQLMRLLCRGPTDRLPDDRRDARPSDRQHRPDPGPLPGASQEAPAARLRPEGRFLMSVSDDDLLELVARALRAADPVPDRVLDGARAAWTWRTIDEELAELVFDSAAELTGVRSEDTVRQLTFRSPGMEIEVMVTDETTRRIVGQLVPTGAFTITLLVGDAAARRDDRPPRPLLVRRRRPWTRPSRRDRPRRRRRRDHGMGAAVGLADGRGLRPQMVEPPLTAPTSRPAPGRCASCGSSPGRRRA